jgi:Cu(I)/Ag(I) efflux system membrane fusion protein
MFAQMRLGGSSEEALVVPTEAVIRTGQRAIVYVVDRPGRFSPVEVRVGRELADKLEVLQGLQPGQQVVVSGQFLIDSEASMQGVLQRQASSVAVAASAASAPWTPAAAVHEANATVVAVSGNEVTLNHEAVPALKWPAMEMAFPLGQAELAKGIQPGDKVRFTFREAKDGFEIVALQRVPKGGAR